MSLARSTDDLPLKRRYEEMAVEFAHYIGTKGDLDITAGPLASTLKADSGDTSPRK